MHQSSQPRSPADFSARTVRLSSNGAVALRELAPVDDLHQLTLLLHRAYARQVALGLRPLAGRQDVETTRKRTASGLCVVADGPADPAAAGPDRRLIGTVLFQEKEDADFPSWFERPEVAHFSLFAVDPSWQGRGLGSAILDALESHAAELGHGELALSMAEPDTDLRRFYERREYRLIENWRWPYTNYTSLILSKTLPAAGRQSNSGR